MDEGEVSLKARFGTGLSRFEGGDERVHNDVLLPRTISL